MRIFLKSLNFLIDVIFPESEAVKLIQSKSLEEILDKLEKSVPNLNLNSRNIFYIFKYKNPLVQKLIWELKYRGQKDIVDFFAKVLIMEIDKVIRGASSSEIILITVPSSKQKMRQKGFNQTILLARKICNLRPETKYYTDLIIKTKNTKNQADIKDKKKRLKNLSGAFEINKDFDLKLLSGRKIIIIDDVYTTGATIREIFRTLNDIRCINDIKAITLAH